MNRRVAIKRIRIKVRNVFALPFEDGSFGIAQIGAIAFGVHTYVVFDVRFREADDIARNLDAQQARRLGIRRGIDKRDRRGVAARCVAPAATGAFNTRVHGGGRRAIENERLGEVTDAGGGGGMVELSLELGDAAAAHDRLLELARGHGFPDARIEYEAVARRAAGRPAG